MFEFSRVKPLATAALSSACCEAVSGGVPQGLALLACLKDNLTSRGTPGSRLCTRCSAVCVWTCRLLARPRPSSPSPRSCRCSRPRPVHQQIRRWRRCESLSLCRSGSTTTMPLPVRSTRPMAGDLSGEGPPGARLAHLPRVRSARCSAQMQHQRRYPHSLGPLRSEAPLRQRPHRLGFDGAMSFLVALLRTRQLSLSGVRGKLLNKALFLCLLGLVQRKT